MPNLYKGFQYFKAMSTSKRVKLKMKVNGPTITSSNSASLVANNMDILMQILLLLPIESLLKFKSVSKHWLSLISSHEFTQLRTPFPNSPSGLFLRTFSSFNNTPRYNFIHLISPNTNKILSSCCGPFEYLAFAKDPSGIRVLQSCNGLFLCSSSLCNPRKAHYYVYNPTTNHYSRLPQRGLTATGHNLLGVSLAFDPSKSPHYKVVCVSRKWDLYQIKIYSSSSKGSWSVSSCDPFTASNGTKFHRGVFCNGAIHWFSSYGRSCLSFNIDEEHVRHVPLPPKQGNWGERRRVDYYFGACRDHLHLIEIYGPRTLEFSVYEMGRDYSCWFVKYQVDLNAVPIAFPKMIRDDLELGALNYYGFSILCVVQAEVEEDSYLVLNTPGTVVRYNFKDKSFYKLCDVADTKEDIGTESSIMIDSSQAYQYIESLYSVY